MTGEMEEINEIVIEYILMRIGELTWICNCKEKKY